jgi:hypothetical protein
MSSGGKGTRLRQPLTRRSISSRMRTTSCKLSAHKEQHRLSLELTTGGRIIRVPFTGSVKLRSLLLKSGPGDQTPAKVALVGYLILFLSAIRERLFLHFANTPVQFANIDNLDFSDVQDKEPLQQFDVAVGREVGEYTLK